jgi:hypothetical protein
MRLFTRIKFNFSQKKLISEEILNLKSEYGNVTPKIA